jgi:hypothetical protein
MNRNDIAVQQPKIEVNGTCHDRFAPVREAFAHNLETCQDIGASVARSIPRHDTRGPRSARPRPSLRRTD